jgi:hypothetical protein
MESLEKLPMSLFDATETSCRSARISSFENVMVSVSFSDLLHVVGKRYAR